MDEILEFRIPRWHTIAEWSRFRHLRMELKDGTCIEIREGRLDSSFNLPIFMFGDTWINRNMSETVAILMEYHPEVVNVWAEEVERWPLLEEA